MNNTWVKLYRKILDNDEIFRSRNTFPVLCWLLLLADRETGKVNLGRFNGSKFLKIKPSSFYQALKKLENMNIVQQQSNNKMTTVTILKWSIYQAKPSDLISDVKNGLNESEMNLDTIQDKDIKNKEYINILPADKPQDLQKVRKFSPLQERNNRICAYLEEKLSTKITSFGKQNKAIDMMFKAGYTEENICKAIDYMATKDDFYMDKGFDLMTVCNQLPIYKAKFRNAGRGMN